MEKLISLKDLIKIAKENNIDLGKGDPYNRLRYYTKIEWIPHMIRKTNTEGDIEGHYPIWTIDILKKIQQLKDEGLTNDDIEAKIKVQNNIQKTYSIVKIFQDKKYLNKIYLYATTILLILMLLNELNIISFGKPKNNIIDSKVNNLTVTVLDSGMGILPKNTSKAFVKTNKITESTKINVTFKDSYDPITSYWVNVEKNQNGFTLETNNKSFNDLSFYWFVTN